MSPRVVLRAQVRGLLAGLTKEKGTAAVDSAYNVYSAPWGSVPEQDVVKKTVADIETDFLFLVPTQIALQLHANNTRSALIGPESRKKVPFGSQDVSSASLISIPVLKNIEQLVQHFLVQYHLSTGL